MTTFASKSLECSQTHPVLVHHRNQTILTNNRIKDTLLSFAESIGQTVSADCCLIVPWHKTPVSQVTIWRATTAGSTDTTDDLIQDDLIQILSHPQIQSQLAASHAIVVSDLHALLQSLQPYATTGAISIPSVLSGIGSLLVPTRIQGQINGMMIAMRSHSAEWKESEVQFMESLSPQVAVTLTQVAMEQQIQRHQRYQHLIGQLTVAIQHGRELEQIFQLATEETTAALNASRSMILLVKYVDPLWRTRIAQDPLQARVQVAADWTSSPSLEPAPPLFEKQTFWASDCQLCQQMLQGAIEPIVLPANAPEQSTPSLLTEHSVAPIFALQTFPAVLLAPLEHQGTILGCLVLQDQQPRTWSVEEVNFIQLVAAQLSTAIIQTRTLQQIQAVVQERTAQLERSLEVQAKLYEKTRQQVEQLRRLNEEREEFLSTVSHELRTPLTSMTLAIRMLRQPDLSLDRRAKYMDILEQQCIQETQLINDLLALRKLESQATALSLQKVEIQQFIHNLAQSMQDSLADKDLALVLDIPAAAILYTEPESLNRVLTELLTNAQKYSNPGSAIYLSVALDAPHASTSQVVFSLQNTGSGILPEELPHIFEKFRRGQGVTQKAIQGTGLGLALVKGLVEHLGGTITVSSHPLTTESSWKTCFRVTLPQYPAKLSQEM